MPTTKQIDAILPFLEGFTAERFTAGRWHGGQMRWFDYSDAALEFHQALYDNHWINQSFDWGAWQETAQEYIENPEKIKSADIETIQKLFTTHFRQERFSEGHLATMFDNGQIVALLRRLQEIRRENG
jgi:hypothetical protein